MEKEYTGNEVDGKARYKLLKTEGRAKRAEFTTVHGVIQTPVFMNVGTVAAIKGAVSTEDLEQIKTQVQLSNTYHLHVRPGDEIIRKLGGLHRFMSWDKPILTDSGGFQVFSLAGLRKIKEEGVYFHSHIDGRKIFMGPEESMQIQSNLGSTIAMAFDECAPSKADRKYVQASVERTTRWLVRCRQKMQSLNAQEGTVNPKQLLFGINQGAVYEDIRINHAKEIAQMGLDGYAIGGLAVGESHEEMYHILDVTVPYLPQDAPTYLMGVGTPANILEGVERGIDFFDCVYPTRNGRHGHLYTNHGKINLFNAKYELDDRPIEEGCGCPTCRRYSRAYVRHLLKAKEMLGMRLCVLHNLYFYNTMMEEIRDALDAGGFAAYKKQKLERMSTPEE
ncbi:MAG: tRNA guanosine(34) transglycosylase Tgt [Lachnospiraceae bacterium]|nr:tRNA guanosine(34) transglycosylase Tgt [Lachnospiraceae bacterium]